MRLITSSEFAKAVCEVLGLEYKRVRRIVIDAEANKHVAIYVEYLGDERLLSITPLLAGIEVKAVSV